MQLKIKNINIDKNKRTIVISDIHGNLNIFKKLLNKINYTKNDILILLGDLIEKGEDSLGTLKYIMNLYLSNEVYIVKGNCDDLVEYIVNDINNPAILKYLLFRKNSLFNEMCKVLNVQVNEESDMGFISSELNKNFKDELEFLSKLPHILNSEDFIFAHAGISTENLEENQVEKVLSRDAFISEGLCFSKYVVVGHWPTVNYSTQISCCNPIINQKQNIISIDGGNCIKEDGQLNALIVHNKNISFESADDLEEIRVIKSQEANENTIQILWMDNLIEVIEDSEEFSLCRHISSNHELLIKNNKIFESEEGTRCYDCTDYYLEVKEGDIVSVVERAKDITLSKKNGITGWVKNENLEHID